MKTTEINFSTHSGSELVSFFNTMSKEIRDLGGDINKYRDVGKFKDLATGRKRCEVLQSSLKAWKGAEKKADTPTHNTAVSLASSGNVITRATSETAEAQLPKVGGTIAKLKEDMAKNGITVAPAEGKKKTTKAGKEKPNGIVGEFQVRDGTKKAVLLRYLHSKGGEFVPIGKLIEKVYGASASVDEFRMPLMMVMKGVDAAVAKNKLKWELAREKDDKGERYALQAR